MPDKYLLSVPNAINKTWQYKTYLKEKTGNPLIGRINKYLSIWHKYLS